MNESATSRSITGPARVVGALLGIAAFILGLYVMGLAFDGRDGASWWFIGGLALASLPFMIGLNLATRDSGASATSLTPPSDTSR